MKIEQKYNDIINLPHHVSKKYPKMSIKARAAQFAPYAALTGYEEEIHETARITKEKIDISEDVKDIINNKIKLIQSNIKNSPIIKVQYFIPDARKDGGKYVETIGRVIKINSYKKLIVLDNEEEISIDKIIDIMC